VIWVVMERAAWAAVVVAGLWFLHSMRRTRSYPNYCPEWDIRHGRKECEGPCSKHRPLMCEVRARKRT
jgi:hypothetical protein